MTQPYAVRPSRRVLLGAAGACLAGWPVLAAAPASGRLRFAVFRNGAHVGEQEMAFVQAGAATQVTTEVSMSIRLGPVPVFRYRHRAYEEWRDGRFEQLRTTTSSNGKREQVTALRAAAGVRIETGAGRLAAPERCAPLTHWNPTVFGGPLFNPQTGRLLRVEVSRHPGEAPPQGGGPATATRWSVRGEAEIDDWYDAAGVWTALRGRLPDRSVMTYRRA